MTDRVRGGTVRLALALALPAALACGQHVSGGTAGAAETRVPITITNQTGLAVSAIYLSPHEAPTWEENLLTDELEDVRTVRIRFDPGELPAAWDLRVEADHGRYYTEWKGLDLGRVSAVTLRVSGRSVLAELVPVSFDARATGRR